MKNRLLLLLIVFVSAVPRAQELQSYIQQALENNPGVQAYKLRYNISEEKINEANWFPGTEISAGYFVSEPETRTGAQKARFSARQMLPWFGTVSTREGYASAMAETDYLDYLVATRKLTLSVAQSYYRLNALQAREAVLEENLELLRTYEELALTSVEVGKASAVDVLKLQIRQNDLQQQKEILQQQFRAEQATFNALLNRDPGIAIKLPGEIPLPEADPVPADSIRLNPELIRFDKMYESVVQAELLNQKESAPMFGVGLDYIPVAERPNMSFDDNGKDIVMPMVSLSIPIFNSQYNSRTRQNELRKQEINFQKQERLNILETAFSNALSRRNEARIAFNTQTRNLKQAEEASEILVKSYETGTIDFNDVLDIQELQLKFQLNSIQAVQLYYEQAAIINYLIN
ncbi:TolC family protein [Robiginitalea sp. IMCC44478]|uniref:TolC family protein n=1 Tax=Robiginitalea sp. IMCC44478 TaxID=3459122 RepID=UPI0040432075